jgi:subtilisin family serine protease
MHSTNVRRLAPAVLAALTLAACADPTMAPRATAPALARGAEAESPPAGRPIPGQYIVVFRDDVADVDGKVKDKLLKTNGRLKHAYKAALKGFAGELTDEAAAALRADPDVAYVEQDQEVTIDATTQSGATWGLDRVDQRTLPLNATFTYADSAPAVTAYIIDTGIRLSHTDFTGRVRSGYDAVDGGAADDCNGHGTHVAGTVGGTTYGVAKRVRLVAVRVLGCDGSGTNSGVIAGMDWVVATAQKPAVANMSLGGGYSAATNSAIGRLTAANVFVAVAAGNSGQDACRSSPASAPSATTVAASTKTDARASYSNWGSCVDLYAPGSGITSAWYQNDTQTNTISGTSMASPHVAGAAALHLAARPTDTPANVDAALKGRATPNVITGNRRDTPNLLLFTGAL